MENRHSRGSFEARNNFEDECTMKPLIPVLEKNAENPFGGGNENSIRCDHQITRIVTKTEQKALLTMASSSRQKATKNKLNSRIK